MKFLHQTLTQLKAAVITLVKNLPVTIGYLTAATLLSALFFQLSNNTTNIPIIFILAIILIARATNNYGAGILASIYSVFWINFAYTYPLMSLNFTISGYPLTFVGMAFISCFSSSICIMLTRQGAQLQEQNLRLMKAEKESMRANLLRAMSHDLRTPLTTIIGSSSTYLEQEELMTQEDKRRLVQGIEEDAQWLLTMVENLLTVTRIQDEKGGISIAKADEPLEEVISEAVQRFTKRFPDCPVHVSVPEAFIMVPMDAILIEQVINNLMENAFFHAGSSSPIEVIARTQGDRLEVSIRDQGRGIAPELLDTLFDGGGISQNQSGDSHKGMGIGLTICKTIITAHGGSIWASNHDQGAMFTFTLPDWREY